VISSGFMQVSSPVASLCSSTKHLRHAANQLQTTL
jgi:hypothetical protein